MSDSPANPIQDLLVFGEFGDVNPSITDSTTYTFLTPEKMEAAFTTEMEGCFLYSRHWNPTNRYLSRALAGMEGTAEEIMIHATEFKKVKAKLNQILIKHTGHPLDQIERDTDRDRFMTADEAMEYRLIDKVIEHMDPKAIVKSETPQ